MNEDFEDWWNLVGSGITPMPNEDTEDFAKRIALRAFEAGIDISDQGQ